MHLIKALYSSQDWVSRLQAVLALQTTPGAIAIGIGLSKTYNKNGKMALGFQGSLNAISSGKDMPMNISTGFPSFSDYSMLAS